MRMIASVIIPTYRRPEYLKKALRSIVSQQWTEHFEVFVLDNDCDKSIEETIREFLFNERCNIRYLPVPEPGLHNGRHAGALASNSDILVFVDDDIEAGPGWLNGIVKTFDDPEVHLVGGRYLPNYEHVPPAWIESFWTRRTDGLAECGFLSLLDYGESQRDIEPGLVWGLSFAIRKETLFKSGGFHPDGMPWEMRRFRGDGESAVSEMIRKNGLKTVYQPAALVYHAVPKDRMTVEYFEKRAYLQGISLSYSQIRQEHLGSHEVAQKKVFDWKYAFSKIRNLASKINRQLKKDPYQKIRRRVQDSYNAGFAFHQNEVANNPDLLSWVLKPNYWACSPPLGVHEDDAIRHPSSQAR